MRPRLVLAAVVTALVAPMAGVAAPAAQAAGTGVSRLVMMSEVGDYIGQADYDDELVVNTGPVDGVFPMFVTAGWQVWFRSPDASTPLAVGLYEDATRAPFSQPGEPGLTVFGEGRGCNTSIGRFRVDQADYDGAGNLVAFAARFEHRCEGASAPPLLGMLAWNATVPFYGHRLSPVNLDFPQLTVGDTSPEQRATVTNTSSEPMLVSSLGLGGADADQYVIVDDGCSGRLVPVGGSCSAGLIFRPTRFGLLTATLVVFDPFTAWASPAVGQRIAMRGATILMPPPPPPPPPPQPPPVIVVKPSSAIRFPNSLAFI